MLIDIQKTKSEIIKDIKLIYQKYGSDFTSTTAMKDTLYREIKKSIQIRTTISENYKNQLVNAFAHRLETTDLEVYSDEVEQLICFTFSRFIMQIQKSVPEIKTKALEIFKEKNTDAMKKNAFLAFIEQYNILPSEDKENIILFFNTALEEGSLMSMMTFFHAIQEDQEQCFVGMFNSAIDEYFSSAMKEEQVILEKKPSLEFNIGAMTIPVPSGSPFLYSRV